MMQVTTVWQQDMRFESYNAENNTLIMDADKRVGGKEQGLRPKEVLLSALSGCTAMDVIAILGKMRSLPETLKVEVSAKVVDTHPKVFSHIQLGYIVTGNIAEEKLKKAIELSLEMYCPVTAMLRHSVEIDYDYRFE